MSLIEVPKTHITDLIRPLLKRFEDENGDVFINEEGVQQICKELRDIYQTSRDWQEALSKALWAGQVAEENQKFNVENVVSFPKPEERS